MFQSGCVKLFSGDPAWRSLTALRFHYETQPLPTWIGWYAHQLPAWAQTASAVVMFGIELLVPFLIFAPRRLRQWACLALVFLQALIFLTGNYCFFNLLTIALCLLLLDDAALRAFLPERLCEALPVSGAQQDRIVLAVADPDHVPLAAIAVIDFADAILGHSRLPVPWPRPLVAVYGWLEPFRTFNHYGLFAVMTTSRREIIIEGSNDRVAWRAYEFKYKPGEVKRRPRIRGTTPTAAGLADVVRGAGRLPAKPLARQLLPALVDGFASGSGVVGAQSFPQAPPRYIRAVVYEYRFTDFATRHRTGAWWRREDKGLYLPPLSLSRQGDHFERTAL